MNQPNIQIEPTTATLNGVTTVPGITANVSLEEGDLKAIQDEAQGLRDRWGNAYRRRVIVMAAVILQAENDVAHAPRKTNP